MIITILVLSLFFSNLFWMVTTHRLINKLMSRSFAEYSRAINTQQRPKPSENESYLEQDLSVLDDIKSLV